MTFPSASDPVSAFTRAGGSTEAHSTDHGRIIGIAENVLHHGAYSDGSNAAATLAAFQAANDACGSLGGDVIVPPGFYQFPSGQGVDITSGVRFHGVNGSKNTNVEVRVQDAYAFTGGASVSNVEIRNIYFVARGTSGGAVKTSGTTHNGWLIADCYGDGDTGITTDPLWCLDDHIGLHVVRVSGASNAIGFQHNVVSWFANANTFEGCSHHSGATYGFYCNAGKKVSLRDCDFESCGTGAYFTGCDAITVQDSWFEGNTTYNLLMADTNQATIVGNEWATSGNVTRHIKLTESRGSSKGNSILIIGNHFLNPLSTSIEIGTNVERTVIIGNRNLTESEVSDSGTGTMGFGNYDPSSQGPTTFGDSRVRRLLGQASSAGAASGGSPFGAQSLFSASDSAGTNYFMVGTRGVPIFRTGDKTQITGSDELQTNSFGPYWDEASGQIRARTRNNSGTYNTAILGYPTSSAYTQTYSTADRTHANATAGSLTVSDGTGTNDGTIGAITADASVIAAVQELAAMINKIVTDHLDTKQLVNAVIDDLQSAGILG